MRDGGREKIRRKNGRKEREQGRKEEEKDEAKQRREKGPRKEAKGRKQEIKEVRRKEGRQGIANGGGGGGGEGESEGPSVADGNTKLNIKDNTTKSGLRVKA